MTLLVEPVTREKIEKYANLLSSEYIGQVSAHSNYIVSAIIGFTTSLLAIVAGISSIPELTLGWQIVSVVVFSILAFGVFVVFIGLRYGYGRLLYYSEQIAILKDILGANGEIKRSYFLQLCMSVISKDQVSAMSTLVQTELLFRMEKGKIYMKADSKKDEQSFCEKPQPMTERRKRLLRMGFPKIANEERELNLNRVKKYHEDAFPKLLKQTTQSDA